MGGGAVATIVDELEPFATRHESVSHFEGPEQHLVVWQFVVVAEPIAVVSDVDNASVDAHPTQRCRRGRRVHDGVIGRGGRVQREQMLDVHQDQLLVLFLMVEAQLDEFGGLVRKLAAQQRAHRVVDVGAVVADFGDGRTSDLAALASCVPWPGGLVIGVEEECELRIERRITIEVHAKDERLEEPGDVGAMPFRRAAVRHGLHDLILGREDSGERFGTGAHGDVASRQRGLGRRCRGQGHDPSTL